MRKINLTLLYVEDCPRTRKTMIFILKEIFEHVIMASDGEEGLKLFINNKTIDVILTDIEMPKLSGIEMIENIRKIDNEIPIVIISAYNNTEYLTQSIQHQVQGYLFKPIHRKQFLETFDRIYERCIEKKSQQDRIELLESYKDLTDRSSIVLKVDLDGNIIYVNDTFCEVYGYNAEELRGKSYCIIDLFKDGDKKLAFLREFVVLKKQIWEGVTKNKNKNGDICYTQTRIKPLFNTHREVEALIVSKTIITDFIHPEKQLLDFLSTLEESVVVLIKIEDFDYLESTLEHEVSDKIQKAFVEKLFEFQSQDCSIHKIYFLGEGQFVFVKETFSLANIEGFVKSLKFFQQTVNNAKVNIEPIAYDLSIMISLGYGKSALENAKIGLKNLEKSKENFIVANELVKEKRDMANSKIETFKILRKAIESYKILSYFQPIVNNKTKKIEKYESLVRILDEENNLLAPFQFLNSAKEGSYYHQITSMVLTNSFEALSKIDKDISISINFSYLDIENEKSRKKLFELLEQYKKDSHRITLEILEDIDIKQGELIKEFIAMVKKYKVSIAIDDFGVGYSNFHRVLELQPELLKIDGSLIKNIEQDKFSFHMIETIVAFAQKEKIKTIAEYVENEKIYTIVKDLGIDYSQGYYFGEPTPWE